MCMLLVHAPASSQSGISFVYHAHTHMVSMVASSRNPPSPSLRASTPSCDAPSCSHHAHLTQASTRLIHRHPFSLSILPWSGDPSSIPFHAALPTCPHHGHLRWRGTHTEVRWRGTHTEVVRRSDWPPREVQGALHSAVFPGRLRASVAPPLPRRRPLLRPPSRLQTAHDAHRCQSSPGHGQRLSRLARRMARRRPPGTLASSR